MRGNPAYAIGAAALARSIPACAGEPGAPAQYPGRRQVYPRVCGGTFRLRLAGKDVAGLSPRVRGNQHRQYAICPGQRSIPACAGEPRRWRRPRRGRPVYPRVCGGTAAAESVAPDAGGLSPRVRGNLVVAQAHHQQAGSIPACAGEPTTRNRSAPIPGVYLRVCGGTLQKHSRKGPSGGLSPRVRGNRVAGCAGAECRRSIPACAGEPQ